MQEIIESWKYYDYEQNCKTWQDVRKGDKIYYYSHGKIHEQTVKNVEEITEIKTYNYGYYGKNTVTYNVIVIEAGLRSKICVSDWLRDHSHMRSDGTVRFASKEAALNYLYERLYVNELKMKRMQNTLQKLNKVNSNLENSWKEMTETNNK